MSALLELGVVCLTAPCGLFLLIAAGIAWIDPLTYIDFWGEAQELIGIKPPVIDAKESLIAHRILLLGGLLICMAMIAFVLLGYF